MSEREVRQPFVPSDAPIRVWGRRIARLSLVHWIVLLVLSPAFGIAAVCLPAQVLGSTQIQDDSMWPLLANSVESLRFGPTLLMLILGGFAVERLVPRIGLAASFTVMGAFVGTALVEGTVRPGTHNLIPFEMALYAFLSLVFCAGAVLARLSRRSAAPMR